MVSGTLVIKFLKTENPPSEESTSQGSYSFKVIIKDMDEKSTKSCRFNKPWTEQTLQFDIKDASPSDPLHVDYVVENKGKKNPVRHTTTMAEYIGNNTRRFWLEYEPGPRVQIESTWTLKNATQKVAGQGAAKTAETTAGLATVHPERTLALHETHRPWFMRAAYYYDAGKNMYNYTTSFRLVAPIARLGENTTNAVLSRLTGRRLADLDQDLVAPTLVSLDNRVDATISSVLVKLAQGQSYVLKKKDDAVETASSVTQRTVDTVTHARQYTTDTVKAATTSALSTAVYVKDYTTSQVVNVSSSAYGTVRGATVYVVSHLPFLGTKIRT